MPDLVFNLDIWAIKLGIDPEKFTKYLVYTQSAFLINIRFELMFIFLRCFIPRLSKNFMTFLHSDLLSLS